MDDKIPPTKNQKTKRYPSLPLETEKFSPSSERCTLEPPPQSRNTEQLTSNMIAHSRYSTPTLVLDTKH